MPNLTFFGYNAFLIHDRNKTVCIDPGRNLKWNHLRSLVPQNYWKDLDIILLTHEHDDHADYAVKMAKTSGATLVCHKNLQKRYKRKLKSNKIMGILPGETTVLDERVTIETFPTIHGSLTLSILGKQMEFQPTCHSLGYKLSITPNLYITFGDTDYVEQWQTLFTPSQNAVAMIPCGQQLTMDPIDACKAVQLLQPTYVIPCH